MLNDLRGEATTQAIPVIVHTSRDLGPEDAGQLVAAGAAAVLSKSSPSREVGQARLREALRQAGLGDEP